MPPDHQDSQADEPCLDMVDIQGIAVPGFLKPHQTLLYVRLNQADLTGFRRFVGTFSATTAQQALDDRREHRSGQAASDRVLKAITFSYPGLMKLAPSAANIPSEAFRLGMAARSKLLGDPQNPKSRGRPSNWVVGAPGQELDAMLVVAGTDRSHVTREAVRLETLLIGVGAEVAVQEGDVRPDDVGHEHFGFDDGVSQPGIRGLASGDPTDFITPRHIDPTSDPLGARLFGYPGQDLVWPGELVLGYGAGGPDPLRPGPPAEAAPAWTRNGSFLVFRRLRQEVAMFWNWVAQQTKARHAAGDTSLDEVGLAARIVGRWPSGAPVARTPLADDPGIGKDSFENNDFRVDADTPSWRFLRDDCAPSTGTRFPSKVAQADPLGLVCPWAAHIRKVNTRDSASDVGGNLSTYTRRLLRVGVPYGPSIAEPHTDDGVDRGLLFLSIQSSIEDQFEFLQSRWMNDPSRPKMPGGQDMLVGQNAASADGVRRAIAFPPGSTEPFALAADQQWVVPTGGGYFFIPSLSALRTVLGQHDDPPV